MKVLSLFSGIGAFEKALENLKIPHEIVTYCEIDKFASKAYSILHNVDESLNLHDVKTVDCSKLPKGIDLVTYGFPCQDISATGKQRGLEYEGETTRSGLVWEAHRIIECTRPKVAICENVKNLVGKKFNKDFLTILRNLERMGYNNYWLVMNAKDYGVPQNRERVFIVSIRKDVDKGSFVFPEKQKLTKCLKDILDDNVDPKYYLSEKMLNYFRENSEKMKAKNIGFRFKPSEGNSVASTITTKEGSRMENNFIIKLSMEKNIRKLTPPECFCLMGFDKQDALLLREKGISDTQLYKMAGNSIVVDVLMGIFKNLYNV